MSFLADLTPETAAQLEQVGQRRQFAPGDTIIQAGDPETHLYLVIHGELRVHAPHREVLIRAGEVVGEMAFLDRGLRRATVTATQPSELLMIEQEAATTQFADHPELLAELMEQLQAVREQRLAQF